MKIKHPIHTIAMLFLILSVTLVYAIPVLSYPLKFIDDAGVQINVLKKPEKVISLVPSVTETIFKIGAGETIQAVTYHDTYPSETSKKEIIGGFFSPSLERIKNYQCDIIFISPLHKNIKEKLKNKNCLIITLKTDSITDSFEDILLLGKIFDKETAAEAILHSIKADLETVSKKVGKIPASEKKRVIRLMGRNTVKTPGDDSFQNEMIQAAGGIPPKLNKKGNIVAITKEEWMRFNPQIIYGCGGDRQTAETFFNQPGWKDVDAVRNGKIFYFACDLTCRASTNTGYFVSWLSSLIYTDAFSKTEDQIFKDHIFKSRNLQIDLNYIKNAQVAYSRIYDFLNKTLIIDFNQPLSVVSTLEGERNAIDSIGNHYSSPPCWGIGHQAGLNDLRSRLFKVVGRTEDKASFLFTGADMDNLAIKSKEFRKMKVYALVTAGVKSNAVRMSKDLGNYYEPGTINIIILPNMKLTKRAMTRSIISATEGKTAALMDMDIRSTYTPRNFRATGTGTDNIIVVQGIGVQLDNAGGHSKLGELVAGAVYEGVQEAVYKQNGLETSRSVFQRLKERNIDILELMSSKECDCEPKRNDIAAALEKILLQPRYADFIEAAFTISDDYEKGLFRNLSGFESWCNMITEEIAGCKIENMKNMKNMISIDDLPVVLKMALNSLLNGIRGTLE